VPKELTHCLFADRLLDGRAGDRARRLVPLLAAHRAAYLLGCVTIDAAFYAAGIPGLEDFPPIGDSLHGANGEDTGLAPEAMLRLARDTADRHDREERIAFAAGFLTHVAIDSTLHPFVYWASGNYYAADPKAALRARVIHRLIEGWLDIHVLAEAGMTPRDAPYWPAMLVDEARVRRLREFYIDAVARAFPDAGNSRGTIERGMAIQHWLGPRLASPLWRRVGDAIERASGGGFAGIFALFYDWLGRPVPKQVHDFAEFRHPVTGVATEGGIDRLMARAGENALRYFEAVEIYALDGGSREALRSVVTGQSLDFGLVGSRSSDALFFGPLDEASLWPDGRARSGRA